MRSIGLGVDMEYEGNTLSQKDTKTVFYAIGPSQIWKASRTTPRVQLRGKCKARYRARGGHKNAFLASNCF